MCEADDRRASGDDLAGLGGHQTDDAVGVGFQRRIVERVARQRERAFGLHHGAARLLGGRMNLVEIGVRRPALACQRRDAPLLGLGLVERRVGGAALGFGLFELQLEVRFVEAGERIALFDRRARVDEALRHLARDAKSKIAFDARLDDARQDLRALARGIVNLRDQHRPRRRLLARLLGRVAGGERERAEDAESGRERLHGAVSAPGEDGVRSGLRIGERAQRKIDDVLGPHPRGRLGHWAISVG